MKHTIFTLHKKLSLKLRSRGDGQCGSPCDPANPYMCRNCSGTCSQLPSKGDTSTYCDGCVNVSGCFKHEDCCDSTSKCIEGFCQ